MCRREEGEAGDHGQERRAGLTDAGRVLDTIRDSRSRRMSKQVGLA